MIETKTKTRTPRKNSSPTTTRKTASRSGSRTPAKTTRRTPKETIHVTLVALNMEFSESNITVPASAKVKMTFENKDYHVPHNFALYQDSSAAKSIFVGQVISGPATVDYTFTAPAKAGDYFFRCDVHPVIMTGTFRVMWPTAAK